LDSFNEVNELRQFISKYRKPNWHIHLNKLPDESYSIEFNNLSKNEILKLFSGHLFHYQSAQDRLVKYLKKKGAMDFRTIHRNFNWSSDELKKVSTQCIEKG